MNATIRGAVGSKTVWLNVALAVFSVIELASANLTTLFGVKVTAGILLCGSLINVALRAYTSASLTERGQAALDRAAEKADG
jgi:hypothetical protein